MKNLKTKLSYALYSMLVAFLFTACSTKDFMVVTEVKLSKESMEKYFIMTTQINFVTDVNYRVGDTLYISKNNCY